MDQLHNFLLVWKQFQSQKLFKFYDHILIDMEMCTWFFKVLLKFKMAATDQIHTFLWVQNLENLSQKSFKFYNHIPHDIEMCRWFFQGFTDI